MTQGNVTQRLAKVLYPNFETVGPNEQRHITLLIWGTLFSTLACIPVSAFYVLSADPDKTIVTLGLAVVFLATLPILRVTQRHLVAGHYLVLAVALSITVDFGPDKGFSLIAMIGVPILASHVLGVTAGILWTVISVAAIVAFGPQMAGGSDQFEQLILATAVAAGFIGAASVIIQSTLVGAYTRTEVSDNRLEAQRVRLLHLLEDTFPVIAELKDKQLEIVSKSTTLNLELDFSQNRGIADTFHEEDLPKVRAKLQANEPFRSEVRAHLGNGDWLWTEIYGIPDTEPGNWLLAIRNISDELEIRRQKANTERLHSVGMLAAGIAHDFNNLLTVILGFAGVMPESKSQRNIMEAATKASELTSKLLILGSSPPKSDASSNLSELIINWREIFKSILGEEVKYSADIPDRELLVALSESEIQQILVNLVKNAKEAMPNGGHCSIELGICYCESDNIYLVKEGWYCCVSVTDDGEGMDEEASQRLFDPYFSTKDGDYTRGLGLSSVFAITNRNQGGITVSSQLDEGTTIRIALPVANRAAEEPELELLKAANTTSTILVVEDEAMIRELISLSLSSAGYNILLAENGLEGHELYSKQEVPPDLVITDVVMPHCRGTEMAQNIWQINQDQAILFITGYPEDELASIDFNLERAAFLAKPFRPGKLLEALDKMLIIDNPAVKAHS